MNDNIKLLVPPYLQTLGYCDIPCIQSISEKCFKEDGVFHPYWVEWRGIFDYLSCVEYSKQSIDNLPKGAELWCNFYDVQARYDSASLVFFSQATLDNIAVWLKEKYLLNSKGAEISLNKHNFQNKLIAKNSLFDDIFSNHKMFLDNINNYRMDWIHRIIGGAMIGGDKRPTDTDFTDENIKILIPMSSSLSFYTAKLDEVDEKIKKIKEYNDGKYLYSIDEFSNYVLSETKNIIFDIIDIILPLFD